MRLGENTGMNIEHIPTGSIGLDLALGIGGLPRGRIIEIYGPESSGKTTVALHSVAEAQKLGGTAAFIDAEHALDPVYAKALGVDIDSLLVSQPDTGEQGSGHCRSAYALGRDRHRGYRLGCRADAARRNRRRNGRFLCRSACPHDESGDAQAGRLDRLRASA